MVPISSFYLGATPAASLSTTTFARPRNESSPSAAMNSEQGTATPKSPPLPDKQPYTPPIQSSTSTFKQELIKSPTSQLRSPQDDELQPSAGTSRQVHRKNGTMDRAFKFPPEVPLPRVVVSPTDEDDGEASQDLIESTKNMNLNLTGAGEREARSVEIPPPTPVAKDVELEPEFNNEEVGETVEVDLT